MHTVKKYIQIKNGKMLCVGKSGIKTISYILLHYRGEIYHRGHVTCICQSVHQYDLPKVLTEFVLLLFWQALRIVIVITALKLFAIPFYNAKTSPRSYVKLSKLAI